MSGVPGKQLNLHQIQLVAVGTLCLVLSTASIGLRLLARRTSNVKLWWDDGVALLALTISYLTNISTLVGIRYGLGRHISELDPRLIRSFGISFWIHEMGWALSIGLIIITILLFYLRLFPQKWMRWMRWSTFSLGIWTIAWTISTFLLMIFQCRPFEFFWNPNLKDGKCINSDAMYFSSGLTSALTILAVLLLPLPVIFKLQKSRGKRLGLAFSFSAGIFVLASSIIRLTVLFKIDRDDLTYSSVDAQLWSCVEVSFGIISACIPSFTPLFHILLGRQRRSSGETKSSSDSRRRSSALMDSRRQSSGSKNLNRKSAMSDYDRTGLVETPDKVYSRESMPFQKATRKTAEEQLLEAIEDSYPGIVVTKRIDQEVASRSGSSIEKALDPKSDV